MLHYGVIVPTSVKKNSFIPKLLSKHADPPFEFLNSLSGVLFSDIAIQKFVKDEDRHQTLTVTREKGRPLRTFSSGERKKALLQYCLHQEPDFIVLDNPFDHLDQQSRSELMESLAEIGRNIHLIVLVNRAEDMPDFITQVYQMTDDRYELRPLLSKVNKTQKELINIPKHLLPQEFYRQTELIRFENVFVSYKGEPVVRDISFTVNQGDTWQLVGPNGSGKSTVLSLITGDNPKAFGQNITLFGKPKGSGESVWELKQKMGYYHTTLTELFDRNHTVEQMVLSGFFDSVGLYKIPTKYQREKTKAWLELVGLYPFKDTYFNRLSTGQQRVALIIRALVKQPPLLILDEPTEGLDDKNAAVVINLLNSIGNKGNISLIFVSHRVEKNLHADYILELIPHERGSFGKIYKNEN